MPDAEPEQPKPQLTEEEKKKKLEELEELRYKIEDKQKCTFDIACYNMTISFL